MSDQVDPAKRNWPARVAWLIALWLSGVVSVGGVAIALKQLMRAVGAAN